MTQVVECGTFDTLAICCTCHIEQAIQTEACSKHQLFVCVETLLNERNTAVLVLLS